ncbi:MAG TPA: DNA gyrase subunit B [Devosia sp.]|nr:DNA gyrase subunit B [Devosia sp.]
MANTPDMAPGRTTTAAPRATRTTGSTRAGAGKAREAQLEEQVSQLQDDIKAIAATLARLSNDKVNEVKAVAKSEAHHLQRQAEHVVEDVQDQASALEKQLKDTIREKPLTAVASAVGIGFILALLSRH